MDWKEIDLTPHERFYKSDDNSLLYIHDSHQGRLRKSGEQYSLVYADHPDGSTVLERSDDLEELVQMADNLTEATSAEESYDTQVARAMD